MSQGRSSSFTEWPRELFAAESRKSDLRAVNSAILQQQLHPVTDRVPLRPSQERVGLPGRWRSLWQRACKVGGRAYTILYRRDPRPHLFTRCWQPTTVTRPSGRGSMLYAHTVDNCCGLTTCWLLQRAGMAPLPHIPFERSRKAKTIFCGLEKLVSKA